ncbi:hypothetical protein R3P38DRAFT_3097943 [Favolaschia claudopus]|uniref:Uncharacterized protein n=1 Tax=Favolaschia claudopus TaxID=2862362 RepID=A0AAV9ZP01_9AGAR
MRSRSRCTCPSAPSLSSLSAPGDRLSRLGSGTLPMSAYWPDCTSTCSVTPAKTSCCWCSNDGVLPCPDTVADSSRKVNPSHPLHRLLSTYTRLSSSPSPPLLRPSTPMSPSAAPGSTTLACSQYTRPPGVPPLPPYVDPHLDPRPSTRTFMPTPSPPDLPRPPPDFIPTHTSASTSAFVSSPPPPPLHLCLTLVLRSLSPPTPTAPPHPAL